MSASSLAALPRRDRLLIVVSLALITTLAWLYLMRLSGEMSSGTAGDKMMAAMGMTRSRPWTAADLFYAIAMWATMMAGMMAPAATPTLLLFAAAQAKRSEQGASRAAAMFGLGYIGVWTGFSAVAAVVQRTLEHRAVLSRALAASSPRLAGAVLVTAGLYQLSAWKNRCLGHCRSPLEFLMTHWREGKFGALLMGARHGIYCLGCCWGLMSLLFAVGVMNLVWVAALAALVLFEKVGPQGTWVARVSGAVLIALGMALVA